MVKDQSKAPSVWHSEIPKTACQMLGVNLDLHATIEVDLRARPHTSAQKTQCERSELLIGSDAAQHLGRPTDRREAYR